MYDIRLFFRFLIQSNPYFKNKDIKEIQLQDLEKLQAVDIEEYLEYLKLYVDDEGKTHTNQEQGLHRKLAALRSFYVYYYKRELISNNPTLIVDMPKLHKKEIIKISRDLRKQKERVKEDKEPGSSYDFPIELKDAKTEKEVLEAQKNYLEKNFPGYQVISRATWVFGKKFIDRVRLEKEDDTRVLMFDVSAHINEYRKTQEINLKEIAPGMISVQK